MNLLRWRKPRKGACDWLINYMFENTKKTADEVTTLLG